jgi:hypothetical protein
MMWVIDPEARRAAVYRSLTDVRHIEADEALGGEDLIPGLSCPLADVFE